MEHTTGTKEKNRTTTIILLNVALVKLSFDCFTHAMCQLSWDAYHKQNVKGLNTSNTDSNTTGVDYVVSAFSFWPKKIRIVINSKMALDLLTHDKIKQSHAYTQNNIHEVPRTKQSQVQNDHTCTQNKRKWRHVHRQPREWNECTKIMTAPAHRAKIK